MGHEAFHKLMDINGFGDDSAYEEACAWSYHRAIDLAFGRWWHVFWTETWTGNP